MPEVQKPHCSASYFANAFWIGCSCPFFARASMVSTSFPLTLRIGIIHDRTALSPSMTVHAPHRPFPQPYFVPVRPRSVRNAHRSIRSGSVVKLTDLPLRLKEMFSSISTPLILHMIDRH